MELMTAVSLWLASLRRRNRAQRTLDWYEMWFKRLAPMLSSQELSAITLDDLRRWIDAYIERGCAISTRRHAVNVARIFFNWCMREGYVGVNPAIRLEKPALPQRVPKALSAKQALALIDAASKTKHPERDVAIIMFFIESGCRLSELAGLQPEDVDFNLGAATTIGKGNKERHLPLNPTVCQKLKEWLAVRPAGLKTLFGLTRWGVDCMVERVSTSAGCRCTAHVLRHTSATLRVEAGIEAGVLQQVMGWSTVEMAIVYTMLVKGRLVRSAIGTSPLNHIMTNSQNGHGLNA